MTTNGSDTHAKAREAYARRPNASEIEVDHTDTSPVTLLTSQTEARIVHVQAICTEAPGGTTPATFDVGGETDADAAIDQTELAGASVGDRFTGQMTLPAGEELRCTVTPGTGGTPAGKFKFASIAVG